MKIKEVIESVLDSERNITRFIEFDKSSYIFLDRKQTILSSHFVIINNDFNDIDSMINVYFFKIHSFEFKTYLCSELSKEYEEISSSTSFVGSIETDMGDKIYIRVSTSVKFNIKHVVFHRDEVTLPLSWRNASYMCSFNQPYELVQDFSMSKLTAGKFFEYIEYFNRQMGLKTDKNDLRLIKKEIMKSRKIKENLKILKKDNREYVKSLKHSAVFSIGNCLPDGLEVNFKNELKNKISSFSDNELIYLSNNVSEFNDVIHRRFDAKNIKTVKDIYRKFFEISQDNWFPIKFRRMIDEDLLSKTINNEIVNRTISILKW